MVVRPQDRDVAKQVRPKRSRANFSHTTRSAEVDCKIVRPQDGDTAWKQKRLQKGTRLLDFIIDVQVKKCAHSLVNLSFHISDNVRMLHIAQSGHLFGCLIPNECFHCDLPWCLLSCLLCHGILCCGELVTCNGTQLSCSLHWGNSVIFPQMTNFLQKRHLPFPCEHVHCFWRLKLTASQTPI